MSRQHFLVTGGAGFIGSHLVDALLGAEHNVTVLDDLSVGKPQNFAHHLGHPNFHFVEGSILDKALVKQLVAQVDGIYHLAAVVGVKYVVEDPLRGMQVNVRGTETILEAACERGCKVVLASSNELAAQVREGVGADVDIVYVPYAQAYGVSFEDTPRRLPNVARTTKVLDFRATTALEAGLRQTILWFKEYRNA